MMNATIYNSDEALKYAKISLQGDGTVYLSFRDLEWLIHKQFPNRSLQSLKALDYGCGAGRSTRYLKSLGIQEVDGFDISEKMIQQAKECDAAGKYLVIDSANLPLSNAIYDFALMSFVTVAIDKKDEISRIFSELSRVLKKDGMIFSLTLSETFWNPERQWISYNLDYPENYFPKSGQKSRLKINSIDLELIDLYWKESDIIDCARKAHLSLHDIHYPLGKDDDGICWKDECKFAPYTIFVFKKID